MTKLLKPGLIVRVGLDEKSSFPARIGTSGLKPELSPCYYCEWWNGRTVQNGWMHPDEIFPPAGKTAFADSDYLTVQS